MSRRRDPLADAARLPPANDGVASIVAALEKAGRDLALPVATRELLTQARQALLSADAEAQSARMRYHALFDAVPDPVSIIAWDGTVLDLNKAGVAAYGRPRGDVIGKPIGVLNPDLPKDHMKPVREALLRGESCVVEVTNMRADGSRFPVEVHTARFDTDGRDAMVAVARDLSARQDAEVRFQQLFQAIDKGVMVQDAQGRPLLANAAAHRMLGVEDDGSLATHLAPGDWITLDQHGRRIGTGDLPARRALATGMTTDSTVLGFYHVPSGRLRWVSETAVPIYQPGSDQPHQVIALFSDVTELKRDSALFQRVQDLARIGGWQWEVASDRLYLTDVACGILGRARAPETMQQLLQVLRDPDRGRLEDALQATAQRGGTLELEYQGLREDGHSFWIHLIGESMAGAAGHTHLTGTVQDITESKQAEETLRVQARTDPLTGLMNRDAILSELQQRLSDAATAGIAVLYVDLDRFKAVNDLLGHAAGDALLVSAARRIHDAVGTEGLIARFGGDEFIVLCDVAGDPEQPTRIANRILDAFSESFRFGSDEFSVTASIGIARAPADGDRPQPLLQNADTAMYESKRRLRNGWVAFTPDLASSLEERHRLETHLRKAADNDEFHLVYQPQVALDGGRIVSAEALIRWNNRALGEIRPDHFIAHAEASGDIVRIGNWVLRAACRQVRAWRDAGLDTVRVAVNVSYRQFLGDDLAGMVRGILDEHGLDGSALELEFTERVLIEDAQHTLDAFARLRDLGVQLSIDDFGEGYSALNYLRRLPIHGLKLSQLFVAGVPDNASDVAVCRSVAGIAHGLGLELVAEGVESDAQRFFLRELGVPVAQGFLFAPGLSADDFAERLRLQGAPRHA